MGSHSACRAVKKLGVPDVFPESGQPLGLQSREETWRARRLPREWADTRLAELVISEAASSDEAVPDVFPLLLRDDDGTSVGPRGLMLD